MNHSFYVRRRTFMWMVALVMLILSGLACISSGGEEAEPVEEVVTEPTEAPPTEVPSPVPPTATPEPKEEKPELPESGPSGAPGSINASNAGDLEVLYSGSISETAILASASSPTSSQFATFGYDKVIRIWDSADGSLLREITGSAEYGYGLQYSPDGSVLASTGGYHVYMWDPDSGELLRDIIVNSFAFRLVWSPDASTVAVVGDGSSKIELIDPVAGEVYDSLKNPTSKVLWAVAYSPDGSLLAVADGDGRLDVIDSGSGDIVFQDTGVSKGAAWDLEFSPDGGLLASCNAGGGAYIWDTSDWTIVLSGEDLFTGGCTDGDFSVASDVYFAVGHDGWLYGWDMAEGNKLVQLDFPRAIWAVSVSGDGTFMSLAVDDGSAYVVGLP